MDGGASKNTPSPHAFICGKILMKHSSIKNSLTLTTTSASTVPCS